MMTPLKMKDHTPEVPRREEMSSIRVKNTTLRLNGQNIRPASKNVRHSKTPGQHLSAPTHGKEAAAVARLTAPPLSGEATPQLDPFESDSEAGKGRPLRLAPLADDVMKSQREKLFLFHQEAQNAASVVKMVKGAHQQRPPRPQMMRSEPLQVQCPGTRAHLCIKPAPPPHSQRVKSTLYGEASRQKLSTLQRDAGRRHDRLRREPCLKEDQCNTSAGLAKMEVHGTRCMLGNTEKHLLETRK
uniref:uncharacterized protein LOC131101468 n=1 Tax=Doryrhamphus excisus TaxID=161450 RepID=UPI0025AE6766|nr:uncharacterized protein LOC131101468 [Doryrhamphus excisus]